MIKIGFIYKITNNVNNKCYIGQTHFSVEKRWKEHIRDSHKEFLQNRLLYKAIKKYGIENFDIVSIEEVSNELLNEREKFWIKFFNSYGDNGYNMTLGGEDASINRKYNYDEIAKSLQDNKNIKETALLHNCNKSTVSEIGRLYNIKIENNGNKAMKEKYGIKISQYDKQGNFIQNFESVRDAGKWCEENGTGEGAASNISKCIKGKIKTAYGYLWKQN